MEIDQTTQNNNIIHAHRPMSRCFHLLHELRSEPTRLGDADARMIGFVEGWEHSEGVKLKLGYERKDEIGIGWR